MGYAIHHIRQQQIGSYQWVIQIDVDDGLDPLQAVHQGVFMNVYHLSGADDSWG